MEHTQGRLVIVRHGESEWNKKNLFTGKTDVHLSSKGFKMSNHMGTLITDLHIQKVFTSMQMRAIETEVCMMTSSGMYCPETVYSPALNERDYGDLTGTSKKHEIEELGLEEAQKLRRAWEYPIPHGETLKMVYDRVVPFFLEEIVPTLNTGKDVLVVSHGNTIRALMKYMEKISDTDIEQVEMPFNEIFIYDLDTSGYLIRKEVRVVDDSMALPARNIESKTQIVATLGPASDTPDVLREMFRVGMDVARLNFFWATPKENIERITHVRTIAKENNTHVLIIQDLPGPRIQTKDGHTYDVTKIKALSDIDRELIKLGVENNVDYIAVSFTGSKDDIIDCKNEINKHNGAQKVIAKIERALAVENIDEIIAVSDAVMIARGDLGTEVPLEQIPFVQDEIIKKCKSVGKPVITATQMLYTMKDNPFPTRAEATDVVNAVLEGSDAVMLSEETASGKYPIRAVYMMQHLILEAEKHLDHPIYHPL